jgi:hypothetical protein
MGKKKKLMGTAIEEMIDAQCRYEERLKEAKERAKRSDLERLVREIVRDEIARMGKDNKEA